MSSTQTAGVPKGEQLSPEAIELRKTKARRMVRNHALTTSAIGLIPLPLVDLLLMIGVQVRLLKQLQESYGQEFVGKARSYSVLWGLLSGAALPVLLVPVLFSLLKVIPVIGTVAGMIALPLTSGPVSYAMGLTFMRHFEDGGTLLNFNFARMREVFQSYRKEGNQEGASVAGVTASAPATSDPATAEPAASAAS